MKKCSILIGLICFLVFSSQQGFAIPISGSGDIGSFEGSWEYDGTNTLTVTLKNTSDPDNGGYITAFALNNPDDSITGVALLSSTDDDFGVIGGDDFDNDVNCQPLGWFDIGAGIGKNWTGGGKPSDGIGIYDGVQTFTFELTGTGLLSLTTQDFLNALSMDKQGNELYFFSVRFRGFDDGKSDKVAASVVPVPESATIILLGTGIVGLGLYRRRLRTREK